MPRPGGSHEPSNLSSCFCFGADPTNGRRKVVGQGLYPLSFFKQTCDLIELFVQLPFDTYAHAPCRRPNDGVFIQPTTKRWPSIGSALSLFWKRSRCFKHIGRSFKSIGPVKPSMWCMEKSCQQRVCLCAFVGLVLHILQCKSCWPLTKVW